jgi:hypothetical protein
MAKLAEGTFNARGNQLELVSGPPLTVEILTRLRDIAERARSNQITPTAAVREAKELGPVVGSLFERFMAIGAPALAALIALIGVYLQHLSLEMQRESLAIQKRDSQSSDAFYRDALKVLREQGGALRQPPHPPQDKQNVNGKRDRPTKAEAIKKTVTVKGKSNRRAEVNKRRRLELRNRRRMIKPRKPHGGSS